MPPAAAEGDVDLTSGDWTSDLASQLRRTADAWSRAIGRDDADDWRQAWEIWGSSATPFPHAPWSSISH